MHQLIPRTKLAGEFPTHIIMEHVFWLQLPSAAQQASGYDSTSGCIDLRNRDKPWQVKEGWFINQSYHSQLTQMKLGPDCVLLDVRSTSARMITDVLYPLEFPEFIDIRYLTKKKIVNVHLPRLKLDFHIDHNSRLSCKQFPDMTISEEQRIGTFFGLENLLVVRQGQTRSVIVPYGTVLFQRQEAHRKVQIDTMGLSRVKYHIYTVNSTLGTLVGNGSLTSYLYKIYLHAVTSHCHPDPLTGRTGTEEALAGLRAAATRSFQVVETGGIDANLFKLIAALTPERVYYPPHLKRMQQVKWRTGLSPISQHDEFCNGVKGVAEYAGYLNVFEDVDGAIVWTAGDQLLAKRAAIRNGVFCTEEFGGSVVGKGGDEVYEARDMVNRSFDEARVSYVAGLVMGGEDRLNVHSGLLGVLEDLGDVLGSLPAAAVGRQVLGYDQQWLQPNLTEVWIPLYNALRGSSQSSHPADWMFLLCTMAYHNTIELKLLETLLAFAMDKEFAYIHPPHYPSFNLVHGYEPDVETLASVIITCQIVFGDSEESKLAGWALETEQETHERRFETFIEHMEDQGKALAEELQASWPCTEPYIDDYDYPLYDIPKAVKALRLLFESWNRNSEFRAHIAEVQSVLNRINNHQKPHFQPYQFKPGQYIPSTLRNTVRLSDLLMRSAPELPSHPISLQGNPLLRLSGAAPEINTSLELLLRDFRGRRTNKVREMYAKGLEKSIIAFQAQIAPCNTILVAGLHERLKSLHTESKKYMTAIYSAITIQLGPQRLNLGPSYLRGSLMASRAGLWPRISPLLLLQQLATNRAIQLSPGWKAALVTYGTAITGLQRLQRLLDLAPKQHEQVSSDFLKELENTGHTNWVPLERPD